MRSIGPDELKSIWPDVPLIDVRGRDEHAQAQVPESRNIPLDELPRNLGSIPPHTSVYVMCGSGKRSAQAVSLLSGNGFDAVNVKGGITEWYRNGYPVIYAPTTEKVTGNRLKKPLPRPLKAALDKLRRAG